MIILIIICWLLCGWLGAYRMNCYTDDNFGHDISVSDKMGRFTVYCYGIVGGPISFIAKLIVTGKL